MPRRAFTLIEVVVIIAIIATTTVVLLYGLELMLPSAQKASPFEVLRKAVDTAWYRAATGHGQIALSYDPEKHLLRVTPPSGAGATSGVKSIAAQSEDGTDDRPASRRDSGDTNPNDAPIEASADAQEFPFNDPRVTDVRFVRSLNVNSSFMAPETPFEQLLFSAAGGVTPAVIEMDVAGETHRYALDIFGGGLEDITK
jgi:type II secretory pathway pseudopilin PulG